MKKAGLLVMLLGAALCIPGCGFTEGTDAVVTVVKATPTPIPTPTPEATPTPTPVPATPTPEPVIEQSPSGLNVTVESGNYEATASVNLRADASQDADVMAGVEAGMVVQGTGVCENGWIRISFDGMTVFGSGDFFTKTDKAPDAGVVVEEAGGEEIIS